MRNVRTIGMLVGLVLAVGAVQAKKPMSDAEFDQKLAESVKKLNAKLPVMMGEDIRLDRAKAGPGKNISYIHTILSGNADEYDGEATRKALEPDLKAGACKDPILTAFFKIGITAHYVYNGKDGVKIMSIPLKGADCGIEPVAG